MRTSIGNNNVNAAENMNNDADTNTGLHMEEQIQYKV